MNKHQAEGRMTANTFLLSRRNVLGSGLIAALARGASACAGPAPASDTSASGSAPGGDRAFALTVIDTKTAIDLPLYAGIDSGAFKAADLDVTISAGAKSPSEGMPMLLNGSLGLMIVELHSALLARSEGIPVKMTTPVFIGSKPQKDPFGFANILAGSDGPVAAPKDLEGKTVAVNGLGEQPWLEANVALERAGVDVSKINWVSVLVPQMPAALAQGQVDAIVIPEPLSSMTVLEGAARQIISLDPAFEGTPRFTYIATEKNLQQKGDRLRAPTRVIRAQRAKLNARPGLRLATAKAHLELPEPVLEAMATPEYASAQITDGDVELWKEQIVKWKLASDGAVLPTAEDVLFR